MLDIAVASLIRCRITIAVAKRITNEDYRLSLIAGTKLIGLNVK